VDGTTRGCANIFLAGGPVAYEAWNT